MIVTYLDASGAAHVAGYDAITGTALFTPKQISTGSPGGVRFANGAAYFVAAANANAINVDFGDIRWSVAPPAGAGAFDISVAPCIGGAVALFAAGSLVALDAKKGTVSWTAAPKAAAPGKWFTPVVDATGALALAVNSGGDLMGISLADGSLAWSTTLASPGAPLVVGDHVYVTVNGGTQLAVFDALSGAPAALYALPDAAATRPAVVADGTIFIASDSGNIVARPFADQAAAFFDGTQARIDVAPDGKQFDFGLDDFTVEAWIKTTVGGEIVSSYPTAGGPNDHGFRLNLTADGELRVAVVNSALANLNVGMTSPTTANDGEWHHAALVRKAGD